MTRTSTTYTRPRGASARLVSGLAAFVLSLAAGVPLRSAPHLLPHSGEQAGPHLGL